MYDCHIHCALSPVGRLPKGFMASDSPERRSFFMENISHYAKKGITALREGGDPYGASLYFKQLCQEKGIRYITPVHALYKKGCYGSFLGLPVTDVREGTEKIRFLARHHADFIKIIATGIMDFEHYGQVSDTGFTQQELKDMIGCAHDLGLKVMVHVNTPQAILNVIEAGSDTVEHGYMINGECIAALAEHHTIWVPTLAPFANMADCPQEHFLSPFRAVCARYFRDHQQAVRKAAQAGVLIAPGSDAGSTLVGHGSGALDEYRYLAMCGVDREAADAAAEKLFT